MPTGVRLPRVHLACAAALVPLLLLMPGCAGAADCPATNAQGRADSGGTEDIRVTLDDGTPVVLHLAGTDIYRQADGRCATATSTSIYTGARVSFHVAQWAESYPMQGWPDVLVIHA